MTKKQIVLGVIGLTLIGGIIWGYSMWTAYAPKKYVNSDGTYVDAITGFKSTTTPMFALNDVATHKDALSCFTVINDKVYDLTLWVNFHPGGKKAILSICGVDGTEKFMKRHKGGKKFVDVLSRFQIGVLKK